MYHAAYKVEFQSFNRFCSQLTFFNFFYRIVLSGELYRQYTTEDRTRYLVYTPCIL